MQVRLFNIPVTDTGEQLTELNRFLGGHKVLEVEQKFYQNEKGSYWSFCVRHIPDGSGSAGGNGRSGKPDYKLLLNEGEFAVFSRLREIRKVLAGEDGVPAYAVFTDEELAGIARLGEPTEKGLLSVAGIGEKKVMRYGKPMIAMYHAKYAQKEDEA